MLRATEGSMIRNLCTEAGFRITRVGGCAAADGLRPSRQASENAGQDGHRRPPGPRQGAEPGRSLAPRDPCGWDEREVHPFRAMRPAAGPATVDQGPRWANDSWPWRLGRKETTWPSDRCN